MRSGRLSGRVGIEMSAIVAVGAAVRVVAAASQSLWEDEAVTRWLVGHSPGRLASLIPVTESTPPLFYATEWLWARAAGTGELALRAPSLLAGVATIGLVGALGRELAGRRGGVLAALLVALSPDLVAYSGEARSYALYVALVAGSALWCVRAARQGRPGARKALWLWAACASMALLTHYFAAFFVGVEAVWLVSRLGRRAMLAPALVPLATAVALAPLALAQQVSGGAAFLADIPLGERLWQSLAEYAAGPPAAGSSVASLVGAGGLATLAAVGLACTQRPIRRRAAWLGLAGCVAFGLPLLADLGGIHVFDERNAMAVLVPVNVVLACGLLGLGRRLRTGAVLIALVTSLIAMTWTIASPAHQRQDWRAALGLLGRARIPRALVVAPPMDNPFPVPPVVGLAALDRRVSSVGPGGAWICEIDAINVRGVPYYGDAPVPGRIPPTLLSLHYAGASRRGNAALYRYQSARPVLVTASALRATAFLGAGEVSVATIGGADPRAGCPPVGAH